MKKLDKGSALVVLSGGQDSTTCLFLAREQFKTVHAITFDYGQRHALELDAAEKVATMAGVASHEIIDVPDILVSTSPLLTEQEPARYASFEAMEALVGDRIEDTFVPMRNAFFLTVAANRAVALGCGSIVTGICEADNANYPDCRAQFKNAYENMLNISLGLAPHTLQVYAPLLNLTKAGTVRMAANLPGCWDALAYSHTSYDGRYPPTDKNHANLLRAKGFEEAGYPDPLVLRAVREGLMELPLTANYNDSRDAKND